MLLSSSSASCLISARRVLDRRQLLLAERDLRPALLELLEHLLGARQLIFRRLNLADGVALTALHAIELGEQLVLHRRRARELLRQRLHLARALGDVGRHAAAGGDELGEALLLLGDRRLVVLDGADALVGGRDVGLQRVELGDERHEPVLERADVFELVLRVDHLRAEAVARGLERVELGAARELLLELPIDVGAERVQAVEARLELLDERHARRDARESARRARRPIR